MNIQKLNWIVLAIVALTLGLFGQGALAQSSRPVIPTPTPAPDHTDAAQQAQNAYNAQQAILPYVMEAISYYTPKCQSGAKSSCGQFGSDSCTCAAKAWQQLFAMQNENGSMPGAQNNAQNLSNNGGGSGMVGVSGNIASAKSMLTSAGFKIAPDGSITLPNGSAVPAGDGGGTGSGSFSGGGFNAASSDQSKGAAATDKTDKAAPGGKGGSQAADAGGGGGGGGGFGSHGPGGADSIGGSKKGSVSGLSKKFGKDAIGVSGDNIFEMVTRRYKANEKALKK